MLNFVETTIMKQIILLLSAFFISSFSIAQVQDAKEINLKMSKGVQQGWKILIPNATAKESIKKWGKLMKDYDSKTDKVKKHDEYVSSTALIPSLSERTVVVYAQFNETPEGTYLVTFFDLGGAYLSSHLHKDKVKGLQTLLKKFATETAVDALEDKIKEEEKNLKKLESEKKKLEDNQDDYEREIKDCEERIKQRKKDLKTNAEDQEKKEKEVEEQQSKLNKLKEKKKQF